MEPLENEDEKIDTLQAICPDITRQRAIELLQAVQGKIERAIDVFFHQQHQQHQLDEQEKDTEKAVHTAHNASVTQKTEKEEPKNHERIKDDSQHSVNVAKKRSKDSNNEDDSNTADITSPLSLRTKQARLDSFRMNKTIHSDDKVTATVPSSSIHGRQQKNTATEVICIDDDTDDEIEHDPIITQPMLPSKDDTTNNNISQEKEAKIDNQNTEISFATFASTLQKLCDTTKRLEKLEILKTFIQFVIEQEHGIINQTSTLTCSLQLVLGFRGSSSEPMEIGGSALSKALQSILGASRTQLSKAYRQYGDMGDVAASLFQKKKFFLAATPKKLTVRHVFDSFDKIVQIDGRDAKQHILLQLLRSCNDKVEIRFLVRLLIGNMRIGANLKTILAALALVIEPNDSKGATEKIQKTHDVCPDLESIVHALLLGGLEQMQRDCGIRILTPIGPMLAHPTHTLDQVAKVMTAGEGGHLPMTMEYKYDGVRCQAHFDHGISKLFSRHMLETTAQYPDAVNAILAARRPEAVINSFIIDAEIVGVEGKGTDARLLPFQDLSKRKKMDDGKGVRIKVFCFDLMYANGTSYIDDSLHKRQEKLRELFLETDDFAFVSSKVLPVFDEGKIKSFLEQAVAEGTEGLMMKLLGKAIVDDSRGDSKEDRCENMSSSSSALSPYEAGTRSHSWLKVKRDYVAGYADTIDVVPIGAWFGNGRKAQKSFLSPVLLAVYDDQEDVYRSISRCMTFTDEMYEAMREFYFHGKPYPEGLGIENNESDKTKQDDFVEAGTLANEVLESSMGEDVDTDSSRVNCYPNRPSSAYVITNESPSIWFKPLEVFEVSFADMSLSRQHTAGCGFVDQAEGRGVALRFPRFKRRRPDKKPEQATTSLQIAQMFAQQTKHSSNSHS